MKAGICWLGVLVLVAGMALIVYSELALVPGPYAMVGERSHPYWQLGASLLVTGLVTVVIGAYVPARDELSAEQPQRQDS